MTDKEDLGLDKGWGWVVLAATFGAFVVIGGSCQTVGLVHTTLLERYNNTVTRTAAVGVAFNALASLAGPLSTFISDRTSCRCSILVSGFLYTVGYLATMFAPNIDVCIFTCGIIAGFGAGIGYTTVFVVTSFSFSKKLVFAQALASTGTGFGIFVMSPLLEFAKKQYGNQGIFMMLLCFTSQLFVFAMLMRPSKLELKIKRSRSEEQAIQRAGSGFKEYVTVCLDRPILCLSACFFFYCWAQYTIFLYFPAYFLRQGTPELQVAFTLSLCGIMNIIGRVIAATLSGLQSFKKMYILTGSMMLFATSTSFLTFYVQHYAGQVFYAVMLGLCFGCPYTVLMALNKRFVGERHMAAAIGIEYFFAGVACIIGPIMAGYLLDHGGTYSAIFIICGVCLFLATCFGSLSSWVKANPRDEQGVDITVTIETQDLVAKLDTNEKPDVAERLLSSTIT